MSTVWLRMSWRGVEGAYDSRTEAEADLRKDEHVVERVIRRVWYCADSYCDHRRDEADLYCKCCVH